MPTARLATGARDAATLAQALAEIDAAGVVAVHWLVGSDDDPRVRLAEGAGFHLVDQRMTLEWRDGASVDPVSGVRNASSDDVPELVAIARSAYRLSRFYSDGNYPLERCDDLYEAWLRRCWREAPEHLLVAPAGTGIGGFIACRRDARASEGRIELLGTAAEHRGEGLASALVRAAQQRLVAAGARGIRVVTQGRNVAAQRLYQAAGFRTVALELWYHAWRRAPGTQASSRGGTTA